MEYSMNLAKYLTQFAFKITVIVEVRGAFCISVLIITTPCKISGVGSEQSMILNDFYALKFI